jgi:hypothetical protein
MSFTSSRLLAWRNETRNMFEKYSAVDIFSMVYDILAEVADEQYRLSKLPDYIFNEKARPKIIKSKGKLRKVIDTNFRITDIARKFGLEVDGKGKCICPFHNDSKPSLYLNDEKNIFHCFGCGEKGDIISLYGKLKEVFKNGRQENISIRNA